MSKLFGTGRLAWWRGGSVWVGNTEEETDFHTHHLIQLTFALSDGLARFRMPGQDWTSHRAAIVASHQAHAFEARGQLVAFVFVEPESREGRALRMRYASGVSPLDPAVFAGETGLLAAAFSAREDEQVLASIGRAIVARLASLATDPDKPLDRRIARAIEAMRSRLGDAMSLSEAAQDVHLSPERFRHLFLEQTGMRFRPYVLWLRIEAALAAMAAGKNITEAAQAGGFSDSAHFARTFKRMFGVRATSVHRV